MPEWDAVLASYLLSGESMLDVVDGLRWTWKWVPHVSPEENYQPGHRRAAIALTDRRLMLGLETPGWRILHAPWLDGFWHRSHEYYRSWPDQYVLMMPGGVCWIIETDRRDPERGKRLNALLGRALQLRISRSDDGAMAAILHHEEQQKRRREENRRREED